MTSWDIRRTALKFRICPFQIILYIFGPAKNYTVHEMEPIWDGFGAIWDGSVLARRDIYRYACLFDPGLIFKNI